jgi:hypothetical protein
LLFNEIHHRWLGVMAIRAERDDRFRKTFSDRFDQAFPMAMISGAVGVLPG